MTARNDKPLVSVIIPVYNGAEFIGAAIESAAAQTYRHLEILVVDDGSTDDTLRILQTYAEQDPRIRIFSQANGGVAKARNRAIEESRGEFIAPLDADDLWLPGKIDRQVRRLLAAGDQAGFVYCWWAWIDEAGNVLDRSPRWWIEGNKLEVLILINFTGNASVPLFRKSALVEAGGYNSALAAASSGGCEDWEVVLRVAAKYSVAVVPDVLLGYRRRPGSMSQACDTMWRSQQMVMQGIRQLRPDLKPGLFRGCDNQFRMYLAGVSFWSGDIPQAIRWGIRSGLRLPILTFPYVLKMLVLPPRRPKLRQVMRPGERLDTSRIPEPLLPYDRVLSPLQIPARIFWALARLPSHYAARAIQAVLTARMARDARDKSGKPRVLVAACYHFPIYSQTFVYREVLGLVEAGFEVRFAFGGLTSRRQLPDDLASLWNLKRRTLYAESIGKRDLDFYTARMPDKVKQIIRALGEASGMTEDELRTHRHFVQAFSFARFAEAWKPDYLHTYFFYEQALFGYVASILLDIPRGVSCYADHMLQDYDLKMIGFHMATCDVVVATSARIKRELEEFAGHSLPNAVVKPNGIDCSRFTVTERVPSKVVRGVAVNRIHRKKGMIYLAEAVLLLRERGVPFSVEILGDPDFDDPDGQPCFDQLKAFIAQHKLEDLIHFRGFQTAPQVRQHLAASDLFLAPFIELPNGDKDGIPTVLFEAMASGCAIVATDAGSITEVVDDNIHGLLVPQCDAAALADAIARLIADATLRDWLATAATDRVRREFDVSVLESRFHERVHAAIAARRNAFSAEPAAVST